MTTVDTMDRATFAQLMQQTEKERLDVTRVLVGWLRLLRAELEQLSRRRSSARSEIRRVESLLGGWDDEIANDPGNPSRGPAGGEHFGLGELKAMCLEVVRGARAPLTSKDVALEVARIKNLLDDPVVMAKLDGAVPRVLHQLAEAEQIVGRREGKFCLWEVPVGPANGAP